MQPYSEAMGEDHAGNLLEPKRSQLFLILAMRIHHPHGRGFGSRACCCFLEASDEALDQDRFVHIDEHDYAFGYCYHHQRHLSSPLYGYS